jgi:hypothetical protein
MRSPIGVHKGLWQVVCVAALNAMDHGQSQLYRMLKDRERKLMILEKQRRDARAQDFTEVETKERVREKACMLAVANFWSNIADFVSLQCIPKNGDEQLLNANHPIISVQNDRMIVRT